jgi:hypothetical protein
MKLHSESLVGDIRGQIVIQSEETPMEEQLHSGLLRVWEVWAWAQHHQNKDYIGSFSLIALSLMFDSTAQKLHEALCARVREPRLLYGAAATMLGTKRPFGNVTHKATLSTTQQELL